LIPKAIPNMEKVEDPVAGPLVRPPTELMIASS
jgi:hypothetical protein